MTHFVQCELDIPMPYRLCPRCRLLNGNGGPDRELPFFPKYSSNYLHKKRILVTVFNAEFSQDFYNTANTYCESNACTLIAIRTAHFCAKNNVQNICEHKRISGSVITALAFGMLKGNKIHRNLRKHGKLHRLHLSIPEAMECCNKKETICKEWRCRLYVGEIEKTLSSNLIKMILAWNETKHYKNYNHTFIVLIFQGRSFLFVCNKFDKTIALIDSHRHSTTKGAVIAIAPLNSIVNLCTWFIRNILTPHIDNSKMYELSVLYFSRKFKPARKYPY